MIPLRDVVPSRTTPVVTLTLIALNVAVFLYELSLGPRVDAFLGEYGLAPAGFAPTAILTSMFLHAGYVHIATGMIYLWIFGETVEDRMGHVRFAVFYLLCGATAALVQTSTASWPAAPAAGSSGAVAGVIGAYFVLYPRSKIITLVPVPFFVQLVEVPAVLVLGFWFVLQLLSGAGSITATPPAPGGGIAFWGQAAGILAGLAGGVILRRPERQRVEWWDTV